jgi:hypothetical protein
MILILIFAEALALYGLIGEAYGSNRVAWLAGRLKNTTEAERVLRRAYFQSICMCDKPCAWLFERG